MEIINTIHTIQEVQTLTAFNTVMIIAALLFCITSFIFAHIYEGKKNSKCWIYSYVYIFFFAVCLFIGLFTGFKNVEEVHYQILLTEDIKAIDLFSQYEVLDIQDKIITVKELDAPSSN